MKITALVENTTTNENLGAEHGLSLFIETDKHKILFDAGQTDLFEKNAEKLGIDLNEVDFAVLSHGHYDHSGGLRRFLEINDHAPVYVSKYAFDPHYNGTQKYIGVDTELISSQRLIFNNDEMTIADNIELIRCNETKVQFESGNLNTLENGVFVPDDFRHEHYLIIKENDKRILFSGCSHKGIVNIVNNIEADVVIGGFHFSTLPTDNTLVQYSKYLAMFDIDYYTCHCTGIEQYNFMKNYIPRLHYISSGTVITL